MNPGKSNATDMTTDMFMSMLNNNDKLLGSGGGAHPTGLKPNRSIEQSFNNISAFSFNNGINAFGGNMIEEGGTPRNNTLFNLSMM